jgi:hypothetical protein
MNESIFTVQTYKIDFNWGDIFYLLPFGDIHDGNPNCHYELFKEWCEWGATKENSIFIGMGDYTEWFSDTERMGMQSVRLHESSKKTLDDFAKEHCKKFSEKIMFMKGKIIGLMEGNHFFLFDNGMTSTQYICQLLSCKYLGATSMTRLVFSYKHGNKKASLDLFTHHGKGSARLVGGSLNTVQQMAECAEADIYLMGHDHKKSLGMSSKLKLTDGRTGTHLRERKLLYARTGSFLKGYEENQPSYVTKALLNPCDLGTVKIELTPKNKSIGLSDKTVIDIHASL